MSVKFIFSNDINTLKEAFLKEFKIIDPFETNTIIVPNINVKKYLQLEIAKKFEISANLNILYLESGLFFLLKEAYDIHHRYIFLNDSDNIVFLQLMIISILLEIIESNDIESELLVLKNYFKGKENNYKILWELSEKFTFYFREYLYQRDELITKWEEDKIYFNNKEKKEQEIEKLEKFIYKKLFCGENALIKKLSTDEIEFTFLPIFVKNLTFNFKNEIKKEIYIFGLSQISKFHYNLIAKLSKLYDFKIFQLNYQSIDANFNLNSQNEFIKKYCSALEKNLKVIPEECKKEVNINQIDFNENTLLNLFKKSLFTTSYNKKQEQDKSIQIIGCPSKRREVEVVYNSILNNMLEQKDLKLTDIAILVTDIESYKYEIKAVFDFYNLIKYNLNDFTLGIESNLNKALFTFLELINSNYEKLKIIDLVKNPLVMKKFSLSQNDITNFITTIEDLNVYFCYDKEDKKRNSYFDSELFTWEYALRKTRIGYLIEDQNYYSNSYLGEIENLNKFNLFFETLFERLNNIKSDLTGKEWKENIIDFLNTFIEIKEDDFLEENVKNNLLLLLDSLEKFDSILERKLNIEYIKKYLKVNLTEIELKKGSFLSDGVTISKLLPMKPIPFKVMYILGLNEDLFPQYKEHSSLDLRKDFQDYITKTEVDNYLFLETILSCQERLYLTYTSRNLEKDAILYPSSVINDMVSYINQNLLEKPNFKTFEATVNMEDDMNFISCPENKYTDIYCCKISKIIDFKQKILDLKFEENKSIKFASLFNNKNYNYNIITIRDLEDYLFRPERILLKRKLRVDLERLDKIQIKEIEDFYEDINKYNFLYTEFFMDLLLGEEDLADNYYFSGENDIEDFYKEFVSNKLKIKKESLKSLFFKIEIEENLKNILNKNNLYPSIKIDFLTPNNINIFEPYQYNENFYIIGEINNVFIFNNEIYYFSFYDENIFNKQNEITNSSFKKDLYSSLLKTALLNKKREALNYNFIARDNKECYVFCLEATEISIYFDNLLKDFIDDITNDNALIYINYDLFKDSNMNFEEYKRLVENSKIEEKYSQGIYFRINDENILLKNIEFCLTEKLFNQICERRYKIIEKIKRDCYGK